MSALSIGLSALLTNQRQLDITGQNIANANTEGYHRQTGHLAARINGNPLGAGVHITDIRRSRSELLESAVIRHTIEEQNVTAQFDSLRQVEVFLAPGEGGLDGLMEQFFNNVQELAARPGDLAQRRVVLGTAVGLTDRFNGITDELRRLSEDLDAKGREMVTNINSFADQIAELNGQIQRAGVLDQSPNDLLDQRELLLNQLAEFIDVRVIHTDFDMVNVIAAGAPIVVGTQSLGLEYQVDSSNQASFARVGNSSLPLNVVGGQAAGLIQVRNGDLDDVRTRLDTLSQALVTGIDSLHATGLGLNGPLTESNGTRGPSDATIPLDTTNLAFPPQAGDVFVSVTDQTTGARTLHQVAIDPSTQSLDDVAVAFSAVPNLTASVDPASNTLQIVAQNGFGFDFAGRLPSSPENLSVTGTSIPEISGRYTGEDNDTYTYTIVGSGDVGATDGLTLEVRDSSNNLLGSYNVGPGYEPGTTLETADGVLIKLGPGSLNDGDSFDTRVTADADTADLLPALGLNTLFTGDSASTLGIRSDLLADPSQFNASRTGDFGDSSNLIRITRLREERTLSGGTQNHREFFASIVGDVAVRVQDLGQQQEAKLAIGLRLEAERQAVSGIDPNEELIRMLQFQRSFEMAARYLVVVNETLDSLLGLIRL